MACFSRSTTCSAEPDHVVSVLYVQLLPAFVWQIASLEDTSSFNFLAGRSSDAACLMQTLAMTAVSRQPLDRGCSEVRRQVLIPPCFHPRQPQLVAQVGGGEEPQKWAPEDPKILAAAVASAASQRVIPIKDYHGLELCRKELLHKRGRPPRLAVSAASFLESQIAQKKSFK